MRARFEAVHILYYMYSTTVRDVLYLRCVRMTAGNDRIRHLNDVINHAKTESYACTTSTQTI